MTHFFPHTSMEGMTLKNPCDLESFGREIGLWDLEFLIWFPKLLLLVGQAGFMRSVGSRAMVLWDLIMWGVRIFKRDMSLGETDRDVRILGAHSICSQEAWVCFSTWLLTVCDSGQVTPWPEPQNPPLLNGDNDTYLTGFLWGLNRYYL